MSEFDLNRAVEHVLNNPNRMNQRFNDIKKTALVYAIESGDLANVRILIENGANINCQGETLINPLAVAVQKNNFEITNYLLEKGAKPGIRGFGQRLPLYYAIKQENMPLVELLLTKPTSHRTLSDSLMQTIEFNKLQSAKKLIEAGVEVNRLDSLGCLPIMTAIELRNFDMLKLLRESGADLNRRDLFEDTPLLRAAKIINFPFVKYLLENGADLNAQASKGETPLFFALKSRDFRTIQLLVEAGADLRLDREEIEKVTKINPDFAAYMEEIQKEMFLKKVGVQAGRSNQPEGTSSK